MKVILAVVACSMIFASLAMADAYELDAKGKCHTADGKFAKQELCSTPAAMHTYKLDAKKKCRDEKGKFAKAEHCKG